MVTLEYIARSAARAFRRRGGQIARAALRALGIDPRLVGCPARELPAGTVVSAGAYGDMAECFENRESAMDGRAAR